MTEDNHDENKLIAQRREKLTAIRASRGWRFPNGFRQRTFVGGFDAAARE